MASFLILGAGKFGLLALQRLSDQDPEARFVVVDRQAAALALAQSSGAAEVELVEADAIGYLATHLGAESPWRWLIPMVPIHVAYAWLLEGPLAGQGWEPFDVPKELQNLAAFSVNGTMGEMYLSMTRHLCPDYCSEPPVCPVSGEERQQPLFHLLEKASHPGLPILVVASQQLAPGVGGYSPYRLVELAGAVSKTSGPLLVATACHCHGVVHGLQQKGDRQT